ncbi:uncharacterized protein F4812DRAFT_237816 [Daldinia caldariorum]|uniref:uncharacterized protein n=1 Tax=Daldinia caldariorum TaxID=326644 RepID=UPI0020072C10|nr:uncharacterized protein F4812DRAFT_237816 [Daldinia caldariorum]KAI1463683.1 hypothetical protein F4812DRAFT_237816 [Daldinia caldariorum]
MPNELRNGSFRLDPPIYYPPNSPQRAGSGEGISLPHLFYASPLITEVATSDLTDSDPTGASTAVPVKMTVPTEEEAKFLRPVPPIQLSNKIHVVGFDAHAKFITHALAANPKLPPVQILTHNPLPLKTWGQEGRAINIHDSRGHPLSTRNIICPDYVNPFPWRTRGLKPILHNIIVSTTSRALLPTLYALRDRIDRRTTICLLEPGLGAVEALNEGVFRVPALRPNYVICHSTHKLSKHSYYKYSLRHIPGRLYLYAVPRDDEDEEIDRVMSQILGSRHTQHMINLLSAATELDAVSTSWINMLIHKLPDMMFESLADTLSAVLDCRYGLVRSNRNAMGLWHELFEETVNIISSLPEFQNHRKKFRFLHERKFGTDLKVRLERQESEYSKWIGQVRRGRQPPVPYVNGYFVRRAQEVGVSHETNSLVMSMVEAKVESRRKMYQIPFNLVQDYDD